MIINILQNVLERKTEEFEQTNDALSTVKELHGQHCQEMQQQIENVSYFINIFPPLIDKKLNCYQKLVKIHHF